MTEVGFYVSEFKREVLGKLVKKMGIVLRYI